MREKSRVLLHRGTLDHNTNSSMSTEPPGPAEDDNSDPASEVKGPLWNPILVSDYRLKSDVFITTVDEWDIYNAGCFLFALKLIDGRLYVYGLDESKDYVIQHRGEKTPIPEVVLQFLLAYQKLIA